jgi:hypothetical protein
MEKAEFLEHQLRILVDYFGRSRVRRTLEKLLRESTDADEPSIREERTGTGSGTGTASPRNNFDAELRKLKEADPVHHEVFARFAAQLRHAEVLKDAQDIRQFASVVGLKGIQGQSRRELVAALLPSLLVLPRDVLISAVERVQDISERVRRQGFSVLTDKLVNDD